MLLEKINFQSKLPLTDNFKELTYLLISKKSEERLRQKISRMPRSKCSGTNAGVVVTEAPRMSLSIMLLILFRSFLWKILFRFLLQNLESWYSYEVVEKPSNPKVNRSKGNYKATIGDGQILDPQLPRASRK